MSGFRSSPKLRLRRRAVLICLADGLLSGSCVEMPNRIVRLEAVLSRQALRAAVLILAVVPVISAQQSPTPGGPSANQTNSQAIIQTKAKIDQKSKKTPESGTSNDRLFRVSISLVKATCGIAPATP